MSACTSLVALLALAAAPPLAPPPETPKKPVFETYHGVRVEDDFQWLEDASAPAVEAWTKAQNERTRAFLDALPHYAEVKARTAELVKSASPRYFGLVERGGMLFAMKWDPARQQPFLVTLRSAADRASERTVLDPNQLDAKGAIAIDWYAPSIDGAKVAVSLSRGGTETGDLHLYEVASGKEIGDVVPHVNNGTGGGSAAWNADGTGLWYTRYPRPGERPPEDAGFWQQVWFHRLGTPVADDVPELAKELPRIAEVELHTKRDGRSVLAAVKNGDGGDLAFWVRPTSGGAWTRFADFADRVVDASYGADDALYLLSRKDASRGKVLRMPLATPSLDQAKVVVPEGKAGIEEVVPTRSRLYVREIEGGPSRLRVYGLDGRGGKDLPILPVSSVDAVVWTQGDAVLYQNQSYLVPPAWYAYDPAAPRPVRTQLFQTSPVDFSDVEVVRTTATSKDGTRVPMSILQRKGTRRDGKSPTILSGYGGYGISEVPRFRASRKLWLEQGGVLAFANIRGGGDFGDAWHRAGYLTRKQNVFDDFAACARELAANRTTSPARLAILGGSNGGLLMGAMIAQHPDAMRAVASFVGIYDMLRVETTPNGAFNVTEFGTVKDPDQFRALLAYSPYQHVVPGAKYPAVILLAGEHDPRVDVWQSKKFAAALQAASTSGLPVLLRTSATGHGIGSALDEVVAQQADATAFLLHELGVDYRPPMPQPHAAGGAASGTGAGTR